MEEGDVYGVCARNLGCLCGDEVIRSASRVHSTQRVMRFSQRRRRRTSRIAEPSASELSPFGSSVAALWGVDGCTSEQPSSGDGGSNVARPVYRVGRRHARSQGTKESTANRWCLCTPNSRRAAVAGTKSVNDVSDTFLYPSDPMLVPRAPDSPSFPDCPYFIPTQEEAFARGRNPSIPGNALRVEEIRLGRMGNLVLALGRALNLGVCCKSKMVNAVQNPSLCLPLLMRMVVYSWWTMLSCLVAVRS